MGWNGISNVLMVTGVLALPAECRLITEQLLARLLTSGEGDAYLPDPADFLSIGITTGSIRTNPRPDVSVNKYVILVVTYIC